MSNYEQNFVLGLASGETQVKNEKMSQDAFKLEDVIAK